MIQSSNVKLQWETYMVVRISKDKNELKYTPRVLLVEDEPIVQRVHRSKLEKLGCIVDLAATGIKALEMYKNRYNLILLDCGLPDISGIEVSKRIRQYEHQNKLAQVPIVMITAYMSDAKLQQECINSGINEVITKPIYENDLWENLLKRWLLKI